MQIFYFGHSSFRLRGTDASIITDPFDPKMVGFKFPKMDADIVTVSHDHKDHNKVDVVKGKFRVVDGPGEYEIKGVSIIGISSYHDDKKGKERGKNTIYVFEMDSLRLVHLGDLGHELKEKTIEKMGEIDILMIPVGGEYTIDSTTAVKVARDIDPKIIIPMHYQMKGLDKKTFGKLTDEKKFLSDMSLPVEEVDKLTINKTNLGEEQRVVVIEKR
jgi:L-ascorbate metabolism protein UlaG (beta-lactamase superfamily)